MDGLASAVTRRGGDVTGYIVHSDRGSQFRSRKFLTELRRLNLIGSMGPGRLCRDNAAMESFFALQNNVLNRRRWASRTELRLAIISWIERTSQCRRRQARLGRLTPIECETMKTTQVALAA